MNGWKKVARTAKYEIMENELKKTPGTIDSVLRQKKTQKIVALTSASWLWKIIVIMDNRSEVPLLFCFVPLYLLG